METSADKINAFSRLACEQTCDMFSWVIFMWEGSAHREWCHPWMGVWSAIRKQAGKHREQDARKTSLLQFLPPCSAWSSCPDFAGWWSPSFKAKQTFSQFLLSKCLITVRDNWTKTISSGFSPPRGTSDSRRSLYVWVMHTRKGVATGCYTGVLGAQVGRCHITNG